ncbi:hypothetical protein COP2_046719 [Malus domestica]
MWRVFPETQLEKMHDFYLTIPLRPGADRRRSFWVFQEGEHVFFGWRSGHRIAHHSCWIYQSQSLRGE